MCICVLGKEDIMLLLWESVWLCIYPLDMSYTGIQGRVNTPLNNVVQCINMQPSGIEEHAACITLTHAVH